ncbi:hypothetical protein ACFFN8_004908, partial [Raoultella planticola]
KRKAQSKDWAFCFICRLSGNAHREQDNIAGNAVEPPEAGPGGRSIRMIRRRMHRGQPSVQ